MILSRRLFLAGTGAAVAAPALAPFARAQDQVHKVEIRNLAFVPDRLEVRPGDHIQFTNYDLAPHTATADDDSWDTETIGRGETVELTVTTEWSASYYCAYHPQMKATLVVAEQ
jgi:plastocyanin